MTFLEICEKLKSADIEDYRFEARVLIEEFCGDFFAERDYLSDELTRAVNLRITHYPLQYIIGNWDFYGLKFKVGEDCLIPRSDTECVVERAIKLIPVGTRFADLCAGSGCIGISVLHKRPDLICDAVELYPKTLEIALENAKSNGVDARYNGHIGDVLSGDGLNGEYSVIISNPPYIRTSVIDDLSIEVKHEPFVALDGGEDGLIFYRAILDKYEKNLSDGGTFIFEIGYDQGDDLRRLAFERNMLCEIAKDLSGNDRVAVITRNYNVKN